MTRLGFATLVAGLVVAAGCGGVDERLSKTEFIAAADEICAEADTELDGLGEPQSFEALAEVASKAVKIQEDALARLRELLPPEADQATMDDAYGLLDQRVELGRQLVDAAEESDLETINELVDELGRIDGRADEVARDYGLEECGDRRS